MQLQKSRTASRPPQIKTPLLRLILLLYLVSFCAEACRDLPDFTANHESGCRVMPAGTGPYRDIRANMEQTWAMVVRSGGDIQITTKASHAGAVLSVTSSGQVIPAAEINRLFQPFQRLGPRPARRRGGHGLGLSIVRAIATAHSATITAHPRPGGGLAIDVTFPLPSPQHQGL